MPRESGCMLHLPENKCPIFFFHKISFSKNLSEIQNPWIPPGRFSILVKFHLEFNLLIINLHEKESIVVPKQIINTIIAQMRFTDALYLLRLRLNKSY